MNTSTKLPIEVHDHFRKANVLHTYVVNNMGEATKHALETGKELIAAKSKIPHGGWEKQCDKLFNGSLRTAQFYMAFAKNMSELPKAQISALLFLENSLDSAAKAAKEAANAGKAKPPESGGNGEIGTSIPIRGDSKKNITPPKELHSAQIAHPTSTFSAADLEAPFADPVPETPTQDLGKCPNCMSTKWTEDDTGFACAKCHHPHGEPLGDVDDRQLHIQSLKTVKTAEALMRAFDDLQGMKARPEHDEVIKDCKKLVRIAKAWK